MAKRRMVTIKVPEGYQAGQTFQVEVEGSGITGDIRAFTRKYQERDANADFSEAFKAYLALHPEVNVRTLMTQMQAAWD